MPTDSPAVGGRGQASAPFFAPAPLAGRMVVVGHMVSVSLWMRELRGGAWIMMMNLSCGDERFFQRGASSQDGDWRCLDEAREHLLGSTYSGAEPRQLFYLLNFAPGTIARRRLA